jgi:hypothetical protein
VAGIVVTCVLVVVPVGVLVFDLVSTSRLKKKLAAGGQPSRVHTGARAAEGVSAHGLALQHQNTPHNDTTHLNI